MKMRLLTTRRLGPLEIYKLMNERGVYLFLGPLTLSMTAEWHPRRLDDLRDEDEDEDEMESGVWKMESGV